AVLENERSLELFVGLGREQRLVHDADVPKSEIVGGHGELTGGEHPAAAGVGSYAQGAEGVTVVRRDERRIALIGVVNVVHAEGGEEILLEELEEILTADLFEDHAGDDVVGVGVLPAGTGIEVEGLFG